MQSLYRTDYQGEFVITNTVFRNGKKEQEREWIDNPIENSSTNHRACCIAVGAIGTNVPLERIEKHNGGCLARQKMQLYAVEEIWEHMTSDFLVVHSEKRLAEIIKSGYQVDHIVYTSTRQCIKYPGEFYLIPYGTSMASEATSIWIACFDGHEDIYLYGYDGLADKIINSIKIIMQAYSNVNFHQVTDAGSPDAWRRCRNFDSMSSRDFVSQCDI